MLTTTPTTTVMAMARRLFIQDYPTLLFSMPRRSEIIGRLGQARQTALAGPPLSRPRLAAHVRLAQSDRPGCVFFYEGLWPINQLSGVASFTRELLEHTLGLVCARAWSNLRAAARSLRGPSGLDNEQAAKLNRSATCTQLYAPLPAATCSPLFLVALRLALGQVSLSASVHLQCIGEQN